MFKKLLKEDIKMSNEYIDEDLQYTRALRKRIVENLISEKLPDTDEDRKYLASMLDSIDRSALAKGKLKIDDKNANNQERVSGLVAEVLNRINNRDLQVSQGPSNNSSRILELDYPDVLNIVDGEMETGVKNLDYDELMKD